MDAKPKEICGEIKVTGRSRWICDREPHLNIKRKRQRNVRDGVFFFAEPPPASHRFVNPSRV